MGWGSSFSWCRGGCEGHINGWAPEGPIAMQEALTKPRPRARKRFLHWFLVDSVAPFPRTSYCGHRCDHSNFFKSLITTAMEYFVLASVPVLVSFCLQDVPKCITASSFLCMTKNYAIQTDARLRAPSTQLTQTGKSGRMLLSRLQGYLLILSFHVSEPQSRPKRGLWS